MNWPSGRVRESFIRYFLRHGQYPHYFIPSSPVVPKNDPTLAFTNAGMNQFKNIILGYGRPQYARVTNSQKCLRINDLHLVGTDTYHHTFFEMLGNWSFANYFKKEACAMAWSLLTDVYGLDANRLYVTYFAGGDGIPPDLEVKQIWSSLGVPESRIIPFGSENFWSMGPVGPCGPSTEIHFDHRGAANDPSAVNKDSGHVVEIWNLVFMQYNRLENAKLERLPLSHVVDTGAGLERLTAVLNGKVSNYDTDLFLPIFTKIQELTGQPAYSGSFSSDMDLCYRVFADHMRAVTIALSDGILPQTNQKIRRLIQRSLSITQTKFIPKVKSSVEIVDFLQEVVDAVSLTLGKAYPEVDKMKKETISILAYEVLRYLDFLKSQGKGKSKNHSIPPLLGTDFPNLLKIPYEDMERVKRVETVDGKTAFAWYERHGVTKEAIEELSVALGLKFDPEDMKAEMDKVKKVFRDEVTKQLLNDEEKIFIRKIESLLSLYNPKSSGGVYKESCSPSEANPLIIEWVFDEDGDPVEEIIADSSYWIVLNETPFYPGNEFVQSDMGSMKLENRCDLLVTDVKQLPSGWILHQVQDVPEIGFRRKSKVVRASLNNEIKFGRLLSAQTMRNLKGWFKRKYGIVRFGNESIFDKEIKLDVTILHGDFHIKEITECQSVLNDYSTPVVVTKRTLNKGGEYELACATGLAAEVAMRCGWEISKCVSELKVLLKKCEANFDENRKDLQELNEEVRFCLKEGNLIGNIQLPYEVTLMADETLLQVDKAIIKHDLAQEIKQMQQEVSEAAEKESYVLKMFHCNTEVSSLRKLTRPAESKPVLVVMYSSYGSVMGRCCVPADLITSNFTAEKWMNAVASELGLSASPPPGQDVNQVALIKRTKVQDFQEKLHRGMQNAEKMMQAMNFSISQDQISSVSDKNSSTPVSTQV